MEGVFNTLILAAMIIILLFQSVKDSIILILVSIYNTVESFSSPLLCFCDFLRKSATMSIDQSCAAFTKARHFSALTFPSSSFKRELASKAKG